MLKVQNRGKSLYPKLGFSEQLNVNLTASPPEAVWYCLHTRSRREKCVAVECLHAELPFFLPLRKSIRRYNGRSIEFDVPLFNGYLFCAADMEQRYNLLRSNHLAQVIEVPDQKELLNDLKQIALAMKSMVPIVPYPFLKRGVMVRLEKGAMKGIMGIVSHRCKKYRVVLNVRMLNQAVALEIDADAVKPV